MKQLNHLKFKSFLLCLIKRCKYQPAQQCRTEPTKSTTKVATVVEYQTKRITNELFSNFAKLGKVLARGPL